MWELDLQEGWAPKNWCFRIVVLEKTLESPLDCKEIKPVHPKGSQPWIFTGRTDAEAETPILCPPDAKRQLTGKDPDAGKDRRQEEKGTTQDEMVGRHHWLNRPEPERTSGDRTGKTGVLHGVEKSQTRLSDWTTTGSSWSCLNPFLHTRGNRGLPRHCQAHFFPGGPIPTEGTEPGTVPQWPVCPGGWRPQLQAWDHSSPADSRVEPARGFGKVVLHLKKGCAQKLPWWSSSWHSVLPLQGVQLPSLVQELRSHVPCGATKPTHRNWREASTGRQRSWARPLSAVQHKINKL